MHPSLLPKYRGAAPIHHTILNVDSSSFCNHQNESKTGISVITLNDKVIDSGKCLYQKEVDVDPMMHFPQLASKLALEGAMGIMDTIYNIDTITPFEQVLVRVVYDPQDESKATQAPKITKQMSFVNFNESTATDVFCLFKALNYEYPLRVLWKNQTVFLRSILPLEEEEKRPKNLPSAADFQPGSVVYCKERKSLLIRCKDTWVYCDEVQILPKSRNVTASVIQHEFSDNQQQFRLFSGYTSGVCFRLVFIIRFSALSEYSAWYQRG